jgi:DNA-binding beta-propeller fold protein YncE
VHNDGRVFVADRQNDRIQIFSPLGEWLGQWTDVQKPQDIYIDSNDYVYVAEAPWFPGQSSSRRGYVSTFEHARMSIFDIEGNLMVRWGEPDGSQPGSFTVPHSVWVDVEGSIYVSEVPDTVASSQKIDVRRSHRIQKFARL